MRAWVRWSFSIDVRVRVARRARIERRGGEDQHGNGRRAGAEIQDYDAQKTTDQLAKALEHLAGIEKLLNAQHSS